LIQRASVACLVMALCVLQGCANVSPTLAHEATADQSAGYVALQSTHNTGVGMAFELTNVKTNQKYGLPLTNSAHSDATAEVVAIKVPPQLSSYPMDGVRLADPRIDRTPGRHMARVQRGFQRRGGSS
jgi:hypothetical protein